MRHIDILGVKVAATDLQQACTFMEDCIREKRKTYVCVAPVATIVDCQASVEYRDVINKAGMTTPDGMPLVWLGKAKGCREIQRTYGPDLMLSFSAVSQQPGYRHYFYGGTPETNARLAETLKSRFPGLTVAGTCAPPFREAGATEEAAVLEAINRAHPDILWVGLGSPKQDYWMYNHRDKLDVPVMVGIGAAFDFIAGTKPQAPRWMRHAGLEWLFRLCCEPRRLWKRYLIGNTQFIWFLMKDFLYNRGKA